MVPEATDPGLLNTTVQEWAWTDNVIQALDQDPVYVYTDTTGTEVKLEQTSPGLNAIIAETADRYGWTAVDGVYADSFSDSIGHGYCASSYNPTTDEGRWTYRLSAVDEPTVQPPFPPFFVPVHPNAGGHEHYTTEILQIVD